MNNVSLNLRVNPWLQNIGDFPTDIAEGNAGDFNFEFILNPEYKKWLAIYNDAVSTTSHITKNGICKCKGVCNGKGEADGDADCKRVTVAVFKAGKIIITGAKNREQLNTCKNFITDFIKL